MMSMNGYGIPGHWDDEIIGFDLHPTAVEGIGAVRTLQGPGVSGNTVKFVEVWDGSADAGEPIGSAGIRPTEVLITEQMPHARWLLTFTQTSVKLQAVPLPAPAPWVED